MNEHELASAHGPYWKRAHRDWRLWIGMFFMFAAILIYSVREYLF